MQKNRVKTVIGADASSVAIRDDASSVIINNSATLGSVAPYPTLRSVGPNAGNRQLLFMEKDKFISVKGTKLPHWHQTNKVQFVTFRLADSLPQAKLSELLTFKEQWLTRHPEPWDDETQEAYNHEIREKVDRWLDQGYGEWLPMHCFFMTGNVTDYTISLSCPIMCICYFPLLVTTRWLNPLVVSNSFPLMPLTNV